ncbi:ThuA domain-containing protein [Verrucomicrobia bacterium]|jgi:type 1 glutamine amidotransferase|nr:ThuA domain-containing protein [Verrucomicrobiota bacterium]
MRTTKIVLMLGALLCLAAPLQADDERPHAVFVLGTLHYSPELTMPVFAKELERFGFRTTLVQGEGDPEKKTENVLPNIGVLNDADVVIFFSRFMKLPAVEWEPIESYIKAGKPVIGLRTASHSFKYPKGHPLFAWNNDFGRRALGSPYIVHQSSATDIKVVAENLQHPIMTHVTKREWISHGTLYLARMEDGCQPLVVGTGEGKSRLLRRSFGEIQVNRTETAPVAWAWKNEWGGKAFYTSFGHPGDFAEASFNRMLLNAICWSVDHPLPSKDAKINTWQIERVDKKPRKTK